MQGEGGQGARSINTRGYKPSFVICPDLEHDTPGLGLPPQTHPPDTGSHRAANNKKLLAPGVRRRQDSDGCTTPSAQDRARPVQATLASCRGRPRPKGTPGPARAHH